MHLRPRYPHIVSTLALVVALASGGAYASSLAKNSVGSKQIKNGAIKAADVQPGALTGAQVADNSLTGADLDESTLSLPPMPVTARIFEGPYTYNATLTNTWQTYATVTFTAPSAGFARVHAEATLGAAAGAAAGGYIDALLYIDDDGSSPYRDVGAYRSWGSPDPSGTTIQNPTLSDVVPVPAGQTTVVLQLREHLSSNFSTLVNGQVDVEFFPGGSAQPQS
jgi:hypothetical protein